MATQASEPQHEAPQPEESHLWDYVHVLLRRRKLVLAVFAAVVGIAALRSFLTRPLYQATAQLLIEKQNPNVLNFQNVTEERAGAGIDDYYQTQYKLLQSRTLAQAVIQQLDLLNDPEYGGPRDADEIAAILEQPPGTDTTMEAAIDGLLARLTVQPIRNSRLVNVSVTSGTPELAASATNTLAQLYIRQSLDLRSQTSSEAGEWLGTQIDEQRRKVEYADRKLQDMKTEEGLVNIEERRTLLDQRLKELGTALNQRKTERLQKEALWRQMAGAGNPEELPEVMRSGVVQSLRIELANLERQRTQLLERYLEEHPEVVKVGNQIDETKRKLRSEAQAVIRAAENDYMAAAAQEQSVASALEAAKHEVRQLGTSAVTYDTQKNEVEAAKQVLDRLLSRSKETDVAAELKTTNIRIVDPAAVPRNPIRPRPVRDVALGLLLGAFLSVGLAFFLEYLDNTVKTPDDVRQHLGIPLLGVVPSLTEAEGTSLAVLNTALDQRFVEGYRVVRTALSYSWSEPGSRVIVVTSTAPGEGKTLTAANLAFTLAAQEGRTLLIDADLRRPATHNVVPGRRSPGLSDVLVGKARAEDVIQGIEGTALAYLGSGTDVPSPADLLTNRTMRGLVDELRKHYDWILIDTPPVGAVSDPLILSTVTDGVIVVTGAEMVPRKAVLHTLERIHETGARILGLVLNRAQIEKHAYYYSHYYGHYYGEYYGTGKKAGKKSPGEKTTAVKVAAETVARDEAASGTVVSETVARDRVASEKEVARAL
jgi:capsular exopolysaccharide synthesis family protein